ncbi:hypothetical protein COW36_23165 [bacterium (Candidatus Blackallbacteria) CG17_big_fil_post_rev_8_21_14_2_50_48_46]|uniref:Uncharacterized protein n=1 Tax=bacterium (Candidatus Blackallbacteria) CG17_big_fil_post_rev_8_21_14_2_50_48_46 TaxID=2014261 RepID=A0A2M7FXD0_9BACT|nr:MAG: hypothetical protein COW64_17380 [bacterium (Candidatus Blackallbacteria) CG18_big_fil_WC_8_21_14_2_50_49_26]PIW13945.1 MAG: hypothetical protein COW36_23165 [bacterium (Candidatus Blackallbacteria) CG17_big_fil_post_rev_8_21_14_2_50_48_46]PIW46796.1 MAG: hypothetical protein COW20_14345 [bacterium (Candidatus Blackallbacteria) CG13_big_fil_rev_8_21_14_2_50_49_14]
MSSIRINPHQQYLKPLEMQAQRPALRPGESVRREEIKVKFRDSSKMEAYKQQAEVSRTQGKLGSKAQIANIKALVEGIPVENVRIQASKLGKMEVVKKYAGLAGASLLKGIQALPGTLREKVVGLAKSLPIVSHIIEHRQVKALRMEASLHQRKADSLRALALKISAQTVGRAAVNPDALKDPEVQRGAEVYHQLMGQADQAERTARALETEAKGKTLKQKVLAKLDTVRSAVGYGSLLLSPTSTGLKQVAGILAPNATTLKATDTLQIAGKLGIAAQSVSIAGGAITIGTESYDLAKTAASLKSSLNQRKYARRVLMTPEQREAKIKAYEAAAQKAEKPGRFFGPHLAKAEALRTKAKELSAIHQIEQAGKLSEADKAIAEQVVRRTDWKFKAVKMLKHTVAITGGALAVASAALAIAGTVALLGSNPVGWAALAVGLTATIAIGGGLAIYAGVKAWRRQKKIDAAEGTQQQIEFKTAAISQDREALKQKQALMAGEIQGFQEKGQLIARILDGGHAPTRTEIEKYKLQDYFDSHNQLTHRQALGMQQSNLLEATSFAKAESQRLEKSIQEKDSQLEALQTLATRNLVQLMSASPKRAGERIMQGYRQGDPTMTFIAERILHVPPHSKDLPANLARKYFMTLPLGPQ